ncbi:hypothetical protein [Streptomyces platensis]
MKDHEQHCGTATNQQRLRGHRPPTGSAEGTPDSACGLYPADLSV